MSYKPTEQDLMAYLYNELEGLEKQNIEQYLQENLSARKDFERLKGIRSALGSVKDKEVIAPPIFVGDNKQRWIWNAPYFKTVVSIAASLIIILLVGRFSGVSVTVSDNELSISLGKTQSINRSEPAVPQPTISALEVQQMIDRSLENNNVALQASFRESQEKLDASIRTNLSVNSGKIDQLVREASTASQQQIASYVSTLQAENMRMVKDYFQLTSGEQKQYIEGLLVDFAKYLQQQRKDDLQLVQLRLNSLEQNTSVFRQETEQILSSIISTVGNPTVKETKY